MGLLQKKPQNSNNMPAYRIGVSTTLLIIGLGNIGKEYDKTRHNIGFACVDSFAKKNNFPEWTDKKDLKCQISSFQIGDNRVILVKPTTYMNLSGEAANAISNFYKVPTSQIISVYDELDIPFGQIRTRVGGGSAGHNGVKSLVQHLGENFGRVRIGTANDKSSQIPSEDFVLAKFSKTEQEQVPQIVEEVTDILISYCHAAKLLEESRKIIN